MPWRRRFGSWLFAVALVCAAAGAHADGRDDSRAAFRRGVTLAQGGDYAKARDAFIEAYKLYAHPSILLNLGIARWKTGELAAAEQDLVKFLSDDGGASVDDVASARSTLSHVRAGLGTMRVRIAPSGARATLDGQPLALVPGDFVEVRAVLGEHHLEVQADGFTTKRQRVVVAAGATPAVVDLALDPRDGARPSDPAAGVPGQPGREPEGMTRRQVIGWSLVGVGGVGGIVGVITGLRAQSLSHDYNDAAPGAQDPKTRSDGIFMRTVADVAFLTGIVSAGVGAYLLLTPDSSRPASVSGVIGPGYAGIRAVF
jgi:hypothetical protein